VAVIHGVTNDFVAVRMTADRVDSPEPADAQPRAATPGFRTCDGIVYTSCDETVAVRLPDTLQPL
jgi:hypothetical protein